MATGRRLRPFSPCDAARAESLAGAPLALFRARLGTYLIDLFLVFATYTPAVAGLHRFLVDRLHLAEEVCSSSHLHVRFDPDGLPTVIGSRQGG